MTNSKYIPKNISSSILLVAAAVTPLLFSSCGGLSKSDRETIEVPPVTVGAVTSEPANASAASAAPAPLVLEKPAKKKPAPAAPPYSLSNAVKYVVEPGDSLSVIASKHGASMGDVMKANKIKNANKIRIGQTLLLPSKAAESAEVVATEAAPTSVGSTTPVTAEDTSSGIDTSALKLPSLSGE